MKTVILCNRLSRLKVILRGMTGPLRYICLVEDREGFLIRSYLRERPDAQELPRAQLFRECSENFRKRYIEFVGQLNARDHSLHWWTMPFTNKNPLATELCRNTAHFLTVVDLLRSSPEPLIVITDNPDLAAQVEVWAKSEGVRTINAVKVQWTWKRAIKEFTPGGAFFALLKTLWIWLQVRRYRPRKDDQGAYTVVASLFHTQSFAQPGKYRDVYFGRLVDNLGKDGEKAVVVGLFQERWREQLPKLRALRSGVPVIPVEAFLTLWDLLSCGLEALKAYLSPARIRGPVGIDGVDLRCLVSRAIREARRSGNFFMTLRVFYCARRLAQTIPMARCLYPYENRAWERMLILGIRSASPETRLVGYQHASVTLSHTNFILGSEEVGVVPLPDAIVTTGPVVKEWLEREGNYPAGLFKSACALRQSRDGQTQPRQRGQLMNKVLVALATSLEEYVGTLVFLEKALASSNGYDLRIRPHPTIPLQSALEIAPLASRDFYSPSTGSLANDLQWADVVLYASSTVGMEAVSLGIPAIYLDLGSFLDTDPMFGWNEFKWSVREPSELIDTIKSIEAIPESQFKELQQKGRQYVAAYLSPVTESGLRTLLEA